MNKYVLTYICTILLISLASTSHAQATKVITLKDGSTLKGEVLELKDNVYTVETLNLGKINIPESDILSITSSQPSDQSGESQKTELKKQVEQIQGTILSDPGIMTEIQSILEDEHVRTMLADPKLISDVQSFDQNTIEKNDNIQNLIKNPKMQELMNKIQQKIPVQ